jgi:hypothetical protein
MELTELIEFLNKEGYTNIIELQNGELAGLCKFMFTTGLVVGLTKHGYRIRFCFEFTHEAITALEGWDGVGYPPGNWIKAKGSDEYGMFVDDINPNIKD